MFKILNKNYTVIELSVIHMRQLFFIISATYFQLTKDMERKEEIFKLFSFLGGIYDIGGGLHGESGFRGCIRNLTIDGKLR